MIDHNYTYPLNLQNNPTDVCKSTNKPSNESHQRIGIKFRGYNRSLNIGKIMIEPLVGLWENFERIASDIN